MSSSSVVAQSSDLYEVDIDDEPHDEDVEAMKRRVQEMEEEAAKIEATIAAISTEPESSTSPPGDQSGAQSDPDSRSVYVGNVDYQATPEELQSFFQSCGVVNRITIVCDKFTGHPKGFAYVEFSDIDAVANAMLLNETEFRSRVLKISPKRTNVPGFSRGAAVR